MEIYSDIDIELNINRSGDIRKETNEEAVKNSLINIAETIQGFRRMAPTFALNGYSVLFEPMDDTTATELGELMVDAIEQWDDRVIVEKIFVFKNYEEQRYDVTMTYRIRNVSSSTSETLQLSLNQL